MTEAEWLTCDDPQRMLAFVAGKTSDRKLRLFACACCRNIWRLLSRRSRAAVGAAERFADGTMDELGLCGARYDLELDADHAAATGGESPPAHRAAYAAIGDDPPYWVPIAAREAVKAAGPGSGPRQASLLRDIVGDPFSPPDIRPDWLTADVRGLAKTLYRARRSPTGGLDGTLLAVLSDALEEAGCTDGRVLAHLRSPGPHVRGCWALDGLLGRG